MDAKVVYYKTGQATRDTALLNGWEQYSAQQEADNVYHFTAIKDSYSGTTKEIYTRGVKPEAGELRIAEHLYLKK